MIEMREVTVAADAEAVAALARDIWTRHYVPIIGQAQTDYMLDRFQSAPAIAGQIAQGCRYFLAVDGAERLGYLAFVAEPDGRSVLLSKIYVRGEKRRGGVGRAMLAFVEARCAESGATELWLTVNRRNADAIAFYRRMGFAVTGDRVTDIGGGFVMDDHRMAKSIPARR